MVRGHCRTRFGNWICCRLRVGRSGGTFSVESIRRTNLHIRSGSIKGGKWKYTTSEKNAYENLNLRQRRKCQTFHLRKETDSVSPLSEYQAQKLSNPEFNLYYSYTGEEMQKLLKICSLLVYVNMCTHETRSIQPWRWRHQGPLKHR
jgi:hypothetical protein